MHPAQLARQLGGWRRRPHAPGLDLEEALRDAVLLGRIPVAARLPSERALASALGVSRGTVSATYGRLRDGGWLSTRTGSGSVTALPGTLNARLAAPGGWRSRGERAPLDLTYAAPIAPLPDYLRALEAASERLRSLALEPVVNELPELQEAIADRYVASGLPTSIEQVVLTGGASAALVLALRDIAPPGSRLLVESPTYPGALEIAAQHGNQLIGWPVLDGWDADSFAHLADRHRVRAAFATFDFHNPTGALADPAERARIVRLAREHDVALVVDETLRDLAFAMDGAPAPTVGATLHLGSLSKSVWAGLRIGWIRAGDARTADRLRSQALAATLTPPPLEQLIAIELLPRLDAIAAHRRPAWERNLAAVERAVAAWPGASLHAVPRGGLSTWLRLAPTMSSAVLSRRLRARGLIIPPGGVFSPDGTLDAYLRVPLACDAAQLDEALALIGEAV